MTRFGSAAGARWGWLASLGVVLVVLAVLLARCHGTPGGGAGTGTEPGWGVTHTQYSADSGGAAARHRAEGVLSAQPLPQDQNTMGWGVGNPEPSPGHYDFRDLDRRVALMRRTGGTPVLTLCCAPDWMKGGRPGHTDWSQRSLETAPTPAHYADFAALAGKIAARYPDVHHFIVWNELKGFYDDAGQRWDYQGYTKLYNLVYRELKRRSPRNLVGGPYVVADSDPPDTPDPHGDGGAGGSGGQGESGGQGGTGGSGTAGPVRGPWGVLDQRSVDAIEFWNRHRAGADFVVVDGSSYTRTGLSEPDAFAATGKFADVTRWLRRLTGLPVWWAEWYVEPPGRSGGAGGWSESHRTAVQATALMQLARSGAAAAFYWNPEQPGGHCPGCLWSSTSRADGGRALPMMRLLAGFAREFPPGTGLRAVPGATADRGDVRALASARTLLVVNTLPRRVSTRVDGRTLDLGPYQVLWRKR